MVLLAHDALTVALRDNGERPSGLLREGIVLLVDKELVKHLAQKLEAELVVPNEKTAAELTLREEQAGSTSDPSGKKTRCNVTYPDPGSDCPAASCG